MAEKRQNLAKSMMTPVAPSTIRCEVLYVQSVGSPKGFEFPRHSHPFWQIEILRTGRMRCRTPHHDVLLKPGDGVLLPAQLEHGFTYERPGRHLSLKFRVEGATAPPHAIPLDQVPGWASISTALMAIVEDPRPDYRRQHAASHLLEALIALAATPQPDSEIAPSLVERVRTLVAHGEQRRWTVASIARALGCSPGHASSLFRSQSAMTLKSFLDQARHETAANLLSNTDHSISEIAELLEFPDVFAFSRFIKRTAGVSPRALRLKIR